MTTFHAIGELTTPAIRLARRDLAWTFAFPHQSRKQPPNVSGYHVYRLAAPVRMVLAAIRRRAGVAPRASFPAASGQGQDFGDLSRALSMPGAGAPGLVGRLRNGGPSCS